MGPSIHAEVLQHAAWSISIILPHLGCVPEQLLAFVFLPPGGLRGTPSIPCEEQTNCPDPLC